MAIGSSFPNSLPLRKKRTTLGQYTEIGKVKKEERFT
jgi:hypothetical protein